MGLAAHRVDVWHKGIASVDNRLQALLHRFVECPRLFVERRVFGAVRAQYGQIFSHLHGAGVELRVNRGAVLVAHVSAYVVAPIAVEHVRSGAVEVRQIVEALPSDVGVAREAYLIAVVAKSAPAVIEHRALFSLALHVAEPDVVAPECVAQPRHFFVGEPLLPVEPPEVDAFFHVGVQIGVEQGFHKALVAAKKLHSFAVGVAVATGKLGISFLVGAHAVGWVQVHGGFHACIVEEFQELLIVGE